MSADEAECEADEEGYITMKNEMFEGIEIQSWSGLRSSGGSSGSDDRIEIRSGLIEDSIQEI